MTSSSKYSRRKRLDPSNLSLLKIGDRVEIIINPNHRSVGKIVFIDGNKKLLECNEPQFYLHDGGGLGKEDCCYWLGIDNTIKEAYLLPPKLSEEEKIKQENLFKKGRIITFLDEENYLEL